MIVGFDGFMTTSNQNVNYNTGLLKTEAEFTIPSLTKMAFSSVTDFYQGGAFSLGSLLSGLGSSLFSGVKGLLSGLFGQSEQQPAETSHTGVSQQLYALLPYIQRMIASRSLTMPARRSLKEELEEE
jgi:hypothetical protein